MFYVCAWEKVQICYQHLLIDNVLPLLEKRFNLPLPLVNSTYPFCLLIVLSLGDMMKRCYVTPPFPKVMTTTRGVSPTSSSFILY